MLKPDTLLLRLRLSRWRRFVGSCFGPSARTRAGFGAALLLVCLGGLGSLWRDRAGIASVITGRPALMAVLASATALLAGFSAGRVTSGTARMDLASPWLATLPWSARDRRRAVALSCLPPYGVVVASILTAVVLEGGLVRWTDMERTGPLGLGLVSMGFVCGGFSVPPAIAGRRQSRRVVRRRSALLDGLDRTRPRWLGNWALGRLATIKARLFLILPAILCLLGIAGSIQTGTAWPAALTGAVGGHLIFLHILRCHPLRANALRVLPVPFGRAAWGVVRLPLALSLGWFAPLGLAAFAVAPGDPTTAGCLISLVSLDGLMILISLWLADSPPAAMLLHATALLMGAQYALRLGISEAALALVLAIVLWRGAKRRFVRGTG
ncbi:hypothetical protein NFI95_08990 [Acetobacteraceae bacterium KSS8]|uniref:Uncharacterized protein n=1 Tax=Endosaccharibacter trunci TaxID=2812733 RepID=A0ABT1W6T6_9PROT|nr:hypothetical protein [Acetobacteraceae bacterium KSS8]